MSVEDAVNIAIREHTGITEFGPGSLLLEDLGLDSLGIIQVTMDVETHLDIELDDSDLGKVRTVGELMERIKKSHGTSSESGQTP